ALGAGLLNVDGGQIGFGGGELSNVHTIDTANLDGRLQEINIEVACDVDNPLTGERGASAVFGPQKGANPEIVATLDQNLAHFAKVIKDEQGIDVDQISGSGAAGGGCRARYNRGRKNRPANDLWKNTNRSSE